MHGQSVVAMVVGPARSRAGLVDLQSPDRPILGPRTGVAPAIIQVPFSPQLRDPRGGHERAVDSAVTITGDSKDFSFTLVRKRRAFPSF